MIIKINEDHLLEIERSGKSKVQSCPYSREACGDWCALFGEINYLVGDPNHEGWGSISLCRKTIYSDKIIDERKHENSAEKNRP